MTAALKKSVSGIAGNDENFSQAVLTWFDQYGRKDFPWQQDKCFYNVWVSEVMLQQTQVTTVIPYYNKFMASFPSIKKLAAASEDEVLHHWSGLGYYRRARNLHAAAKIIENDFAGRFPEQFDAVLSLPGIGRSTAGAILSLVAGQALAILDGNVKRVLARYQAIAGWPGKTQVLNQLWTVAESLLPYDRVDDYNQAMMDLGATVCMRSSPACESCPLSHSCVAFATNTVEKYPGKRAKKILPERQVFMLLARTSKGVYLEKRPPTGVWPGLWSLPEFSELSSATDWLQQHFNISQPSLATGKNLRHTFSHFHLDITPIIIDLKTTVTGVSEKDSVWHNKASTGRGLATPIQKLLNDYAG